MKTSNVVFFVCFRRCFSPYHRTSGCERAKHRSRSLSSGVGGSRRGRKTMSSSSNNMNHQSRTTSAEYSNNDDNESNLNLPRTNNQRVSTPTKVDFNFLQASTERFHSSGEEYDNEDNEDNNDDDGDGDEQQARKHQQNKHPELILQQRSSSSQNRNRHMEEFALKYPSRLKSRNFSERRVKVPMCSTLQPPLQTSYPLLAGKVKRKGTPHLSLLKTPY